jgi:cytochrome c oxidase cbb3-type subunit 4
MATYEFLSRFAGLFGTLYFAAIFAAVLFYALQPSKKKLFDDAANMPLRED